MDSGSFFDDPGFESGYPIDDPIFTPDPTQTDTYEQDYQGGHSAGDPATSPLGEGDFGGWDKVLAALTKGAGGLAGSKGGFGDILKALTGSGDISSLLPLFALLAGGLNGSDAQRQASHQLQDAAKQANSDATGLINGASANYKPYIDAGADAVAKMQGFDRSPLAAKFHSQAPPTDLDKRFVATPKLTLASLARR